jgi:hypothetical protein
MREQDNKTIFENLIGQGLWSFEQAPEYAKSLKRQHGEDAIKIAFDEEAKALNNGSTAIAVFWSHVQDCINPYPVKSEH